jgi:hypothetical protein
MAHSEKFVLLTWQFYMFSRAWQQAKVDKYVQYAMLNLNYLKFYVEHNKSTNYDKYPELWDLESLDIAPMYAFHVK